MSTKKLSRTLSENDRSSKKDRRFLHKEHRANERAYLDNIRKDIDYADDDKTPFRQRMWHSYRGSFHCSPAFRWLKAQLGRVWNDVRSELAKELDSGSDAFKYLAKKVEDNQDFRYSGYASNLDYKTESHSKNDFFVDDLGILRIKTYVPRSHFAHCNTQKVAEWLNGRIVSRIGNKAYWCIPVSRSAWADEWRCIWNGYNGLVYEKLVFASIWKGDKLEHNVPQWKPYLSHIYSRQDKEFNKEEYDFWNSIPEYYQKIILKYSPNSKDLQRTSAWGWYY
jgi:hypothetical protein